MVGKLLLAATPLGNTDDTSYRLRSAIQTSDIIAAEDTRKAKDLFQRLSIAPKAQMISFYDHNESLRVGGILKALHNGLTVLLISDAGMPLISDPGYLLVKECIAANIPITALPGPSAVLTALVLSGLPADRFCFEGFAPRKSQARARWLESLILEKRTIIFFESPHRIHQCLQQAVGILGANRQTVLCRELTKIYEEVIRLPLGQLNLWATGREVKGELTVLFGPMLQQEISFEDAIHQIDELIVSGKKLKSASAIVAQKLKLSRKELYNAYLDVRNKRTLTAEE